MPNLRRFGAPTLAITILIILSVFLLVSVGEGFKFLGVRKESVSLRKRDWMTVTFSLPWKGPQGTPPTEAKAISPVLDGLLGDVTNVASAILHDGSNVADDVSSQGDALQSNAANSPTQASIVFLGGDAVVASIMNEVNSIVNDATGVIGGVIGDATSVVGMIIGGLTTSRNLNTSLVATTASSPTTSGDPQEFLPQSHSSSSTVLPMSRTFAATLPSFSSSSATPAAVPCPMMATTTLTPCCGPPTTVTCTVTETWHSTHYESTQTLYSFMSIFTVTSTETISVCPLSNPYLFQQNSTIPLSSSSSVITCTSGALGMPAEDGPAVLTSQESGWPMKGTTSTSGLSGDAISLVSSLLSTVGINVMSSSSPSTMASFTVNLPSLPSSMALVTSVASVLASVTCDGGSLVTRIQDCPNGLSKPTSTSPLAFRTSPPPAAATSAAGTGNTMLSNKVANVVSVLSRIQGLSGDLLSTVMSDVASALSTANALPGSVLPSNGALALVSPVGMVSDAIVPTLGAVAASAGNEVTSVGNVLATVTRAPVSAVGLGELAGNIVPNLGDVAAPIGNGIKPAGSVSIAGGVTVVGNNNILRRLETGVNGAPTRLDIVTTVLNGKPTAVPGVDMVVNGYSTQLPAANDDANLLVGLNGESAAGIAMGRRRVVKRGKATTGGLVL